MSKEHSIPSLTQSLVSSDTVTGPNGRADMDGNEDENKWFDRKVTMVTRSDAVSEPDDTGHEHDEGSDFHTHSGEENDGKCAISLNC
jgi:hypothetical protein